MAASNTYISSESFKMPSEPCPLPSLGSDEESFVVLWKDMDKALSEDLDEPVGMSIVEEAKQLIHKELQELNQNQIQTDGLTKEDVLQKSQQADTQLQQSEVASEKTLTASRMEESTTLPKMPQVEKGFDTTDVISITTFSADWTSEEVQKRVAQIVEENIRLKDTILQNNMSLKSQYERIVAWQGDVQKVHQAHRDKIMEAKEYIERLKKENYRFARDLEKLREIRDLQDDELISLKQALKEKEGQANEMLVRGSGDNIKDRELEITQKKVKETEFALQNVKLENAVLREDKVKLEKYNSKIDEYEKEIEKLQELLNASKLQVEEAKMELLKLKSVEEEKQKSLNEAIQGLQSQIYYMAQQNAVPAEEIANLRQQLTNAQITLTQLEQSRAGAYFQVETLNKEILELRKQLEQSQAQKDEIFALQTQLDVYKADFEAERNAKETIKAENDKFSEDMQNLQRRNQQLQEEIELIRERDYVVYPPYRRQTASATSTSANNEHSLKCPKCNFGFNTLQALENHVYRCIELDDSLP